MSAERGMARECVRPRLATYDKIRGMKGDRNILRSCVSMYLLLLAGYIGGIALYSMLEHTHIWWISSEISLWSVLGLMFSPVGIAVIGPLFFAAFVCCLFLVRGGTPLAWVIFILSGLIYFVLLRVVRMWFAVSSKKAKWLSGSFLIAYSALATMSLMIVSQRM